MVHPLDSVSRCPQKSPALKKRRCVAFHFTESRRVFIYHDQKRIPVTGNCIRIRFIGIVKRRRPSNDTIIGYLIEEVVIAAF